MQRPLFLAHHRIFQELHSRSKLQIFFKRINNHLLITLDGSKYLNSYKIHCYIVRITLPKNIPKGI